MSETMRSTREDELAAIAPNRSDLPDALDGEMHLTLRAALDAAHDTRAVLLTVAGRGFGAGQDLSRRDPATAGGVPDLRAFLGKRTAAFAGAAS